MVEGSCLCGAIRFGVDGRFTPIQFCHCRRCRKSTGSAFAAGIAARTHAFRWLAGEELAQQYTAPVRESPPPYRAAFCKQCGSPVPIYDSEQPFVIIPAGALDADPGTRPLRHIFVGVKAPWFEITDAVPQFAKHVPPEQQLPRKAE